jgi:uncharacterized protein YcfJ
MMKIYLFEEHEMKKFLAIALSVMATGAMAQTTYVQNATVVEVSPKYEQFRVTNPQQVCQQVEVPVYRTTTQRGGDNLGSFIVGAVIGNAIGKATGVDGGQAIGTIIGGAVANEHQKDHNTSSTNEIIGYRQEQRCGTQYSTEVQERFIGNYVTVDYNGMRMSYTTRDANVKIGDLVRITVAIRK